MPSAPYETLSAVEQVRRLRFTARLAAGEWGLSDVRLRPVGHAENTTFRVEATLGGRGGRPSRQRHAFLLRLHRPRRHSAAALRSELAWLRALVEAGELAVPEPVATPAGELVVDVDAVAARAVGGEARACTLLRWLPGRILGQRAGAARLRELGRVAARLHRFARRWRRPAGFRRHAWDRAGLFEEPCNDLPRTEIRRRLPGERWRLVEAAEEWLCEILAAMGPDDRGLIHADLHVRNALLHRDTGELCVIDFDDCGHGAWLYDLAVPIEDLGWSGRAEEARAAVITGYREVGGPAVAWLDDCEPLDGLVAARGASAMLWLVDRASQNDRMRRHLERWLRRLTPPLRARLREHGRLGRRARPG